MIRCIHTTNNNLHNAKIFLQVELDSHLDIEASIILKQIQTEDVRCSANSKYFNTICEKLFLHVQQDT